MEYQGILTGFPTEVVEKVMLVSDLDDFQKAQRANTRRVVFMKKNGTYLAWDAETLEVAKDTLHIFKWKYAWDIPEGTIVEITADEALEIVAQHKGVDLKKLRIKK